MAGKPNEAIGGRVSTKATSLRKLCREVVANLVESFTTRG